MSKIVTYLKALGRATFQVTIHHPLAAAATVFIVIGAVVMLAFGKTIQIGGLLGKLWGSKPPNPDIRVVPPPNRVDDKGNIIPIGQSDDKGFVEAPITTDIKSPGIFTDPSTITVVHPDKGKVVIPLPTGVVNTDVKQVIEIAPDVYQIHSQDKGVDPQKALDILNK